MSRLWRDEIRVALGSGGPAELSGLRRGARLTVILSSHHVRYALLPWSANLGREEEWLAYARFRLRETYGAAADGWEVRISPADPRAARVACAVERRLLDDLRTAADQAGVRLVSVQPSLMHAFNVHRREFERDDGWLVNAERGRLTIALIANRAWQLVRVRNAGPDWRDRLQSLLRREEALAARVESVARVVLMESPMAA